MKIFAMLYFWIYLYWYQFRLKTKLVDDATKTISVRLFMFGCEDWVVFRHSDRQVGWKFPDVWFWKKYYNKWIKLVVWLDDDNYINELMDKQLIWCDKMLKHDWNTFNSCYWAFENYNDAMMFRMVWGGEDADSHDEKMELEREEQKKKEKERHKQFNDLVKMGTIDLNNLTSKQQDEWSDVLMDRMFDI